MEISEGFARACRVQEIRWRHNFINLSVSGDNATPAGDGVSNLLKYSANLSPNAVGRGAVPTCGIATIGSNRYLTLTYRQASTATDLVFSTELNAGSLSPGTWAAGGVTVGQPVPNGDGTQTVTVRDAVPISGQRDSGLCACASVARNRAARCGECAAAAVGRRGNASRAESLSIKTEARSSSFWIARLTPRA